MLLVFATSTIDRAELDYYMMVPQVNGLTVKDQETPRLKVLYKHYGIVRLWMQLPQR